MVSNLIGKVQYSKRQAALAASATITAVLLFSTMVSGLFAGMGLDVVPFAQAQQNQSNVTTSGNNTTNTTIATASSYDEMLNPRQKEYPAH